MKSWRRIAALALALCLALVPAQCFAVSAPKQAIIKEAPVAGEYAFNRGGLGLIEESDGTRHLIDRDGGRIIYVYGAFVIPDGFPYKDYLKNDRSAYKADSLKAFTVYNHSFDGGKSWDEFDD